MLRPLRGLPYRKLAPALRAGKPKFLGAAGTPMGLKQDRVASQREEWP